MPILKPTRGAQLNRSHPLCRGLVGCWLFNEGTGGKVFDLSGNGNAGTLFDGTHFVPGKFGSCLSFDGDGDYVDCGNNAGNVTDKMTWSFWTKINSQIGTPHGFINKYTASGTNRAYFMRSSTSNTDLWLTASADGTANTLASVVWANLFDFGIWTHIALVKVGNNITAYKNGVAQSTQTLVIWANANTSFCIGKTYNPYYLNGLIDNVMIQNRALSAAEIAWLYRDPFCMFERATDAAFLFVPTVNLYGSTSSQSSTIATIKIVKRIKSASAVASKTSAMLKITGEALLAGSTDTKAVSSGKLTLSYRGPWLKSPLKIERYWLTDALFNGMTSNAFKLGTALSSSWFWMRQKSCSSLYCGRTMEKIDFTNILVVVGQETKLLSPPDYVTHKKDSVYFYVIRRFNSYGCQERTLQAAAMAIFDADGNLARPQPNNIFTANVGLVNGNKVLLNWLYCPLEQKSQPVCFKVYYDGGTGHIDYGNPITEISYRGTKYYSYTSDTLSAGRYLFAIRAEDENGAENNSLSRLEIQINTHNPDAVEILSVEEI